MKGMRKTKALAFVKKDFYRKEFRRHFCAVILFGKISEAGQSLLKTRNVITGRNTLGNVYALGGSR
jgi:hypothetical protein